MRTALAQLDPAQLAQLPRTTRWRAKKRGWVVLNYHQRWIHTQARSEAERWALIAESLPREARRMVVRMMRLGYPWPSFMDFDDLVQECQIEIWRVCAKPEAQIRSWRFAAMRYRLLQISKSVAHDSDRHNLTSLRGRTKRNHES